MSTQTAPANYSQLIAKISVLDIAIAKLVKWNDAANFKSGSLMISGHTQLQKPFHEILVFDAGLPIPVDRLKTFINDYVQDLVHARFKLIAQLEGQPQQKSIIADHIIDKSEFFCPVCTKLTDHNLHKSEMGIHWQCVECSNINTNAEID